MTGKKLCAVKGCERPAKAHALCVAHYRVWLKTGEPMGERHAPKRPRASRGAPLAYLRAAINDPHNLCVLWPYALNVDGHPRLRLKDQHFYAHRLACEAVHGPAPSDRHQAAHECGETRCVNPKHLRWSTPAENAADGKRVGRRPGSYKLNDAKALAIRNLVGHTNYRSIGRGFGVSGRSVSQVVRLLNWPIEDDDPAAT
jgi:hypothetical protein